MKLTRAAGWFSSIAGVASIVLSRWGFMTPYDSKDCVKVTEAFVLGSWVIAPPAWFWYEYYRLYKKCNWPAADLDGFKYGQDQASKIWLALVTLLLVIYFGKDLMRDKPPPCSAQPTSIPTAKP